jgi:ABC-2 type transport system permease protein
MFTRLIAFEWRYFVRQPSFVVTSMVFFLLPFLYMTINLIPKPGGANVVFNSPYGITVLMLLFGQLAMFLVVNFAGNTAIRNYSSHMAEIIYTKPITPLSYQLGRFLGSYLVCVTVFAFVPLGLFLGSVMPWVDGTRIGPHVLAHYIIPFVYFSLTTLFVLSALFYAAALRFNSMMAVYLMALGLFILNIVIGQVFNGPDQKELLALLDPFAQRTFGGLSEYWTPSERNKELASLTSSVIMNRVIWIGIGLAILFGVGGLFKPLTLKKGKSPKVKKTTSKLETKISALLNNVINYSYEKGSTGLQFATRTVFEAKQIASSPAFLVLLAVITAFLIGLLYFASGRYGATSWPLTQTMVFAIVGGSGFVQLIIIAYYSAEVVWRERSSGMGDIIDSMPVGNFTFWASKILSVSLVIFAIYAVGMLSTILFQLSKGQANIEITQYLTSLIFFFFIPSLFTISLAFFIQALSSNKYLGMLVFFGYAVVSGVLPVIGLEHNMLNFGVAPVLRYSDLNGYGWFLETQAWYTAYWGAISLILGIISYGLWQRGPQMKLKAKFKLLSYNIGHGGKVGIAVLLIVFLGSGANIFYNTTILNTFTSSDTKLDMQETYEKAYVEYEESPFPVVAAVDANIEIYPKDRRIVAKADIVVENQTKEPVKRFLVNLPLSSNVEIEGGQLGDIEQEITLGGSGIFGGSEQSFSTAWFEFDSPILPGEKRNGSLSVVREIIGFKDRGEDTFLVNDGTFVNNFALFPSFGVNRGVYIGSKSERQKRDLPPAKRSYKLEDTSHYTESFFGPGIGLIDFAATVSTSAEQTAITPGYLTKQWQENGRNYFRYEMDAPMINFFNVMSGELEVKKEMHNDVEIAIYYHKTHYWNVDRMIESVKDSLDYFSEAFGPYQHRQLRIIEFPGYAGFAQSFANTVPYSEQAGFITDLRDPKKIDPVYYVTAHEVAHQWFGHQLTSANVQGSQVLSESLSQYAALMVMENKYGADKMRQFLAFELDSYLRGRTSDPGEEMPLLRTENQLYIHYQKGSIVMMALKEKLGEQALNKALSGLLQKFKFTRGAKPTTLDLVAALKAEADLEQRDFIDSSFNDITLYDIKTTDSSVEEVDGEYTVKVTVEATQFTADGFGEETEEDFDELVDVVLFINDPNNFATESEIVYRQKHRFVSGKNEIEIVVSEEPKFVGVDPFVRFIDRDTGDNIRAL